MVLGSNNLRFNYNTNAINNPIIIQSFFYPPYYSPTTIQGTRTDLGIASINTISTNNFAGLIAQPYNPIDLVILEFQIINYNLSTNLEWRLLETPKTAMIYSNHKTFFFQAITLQPVNYTLECFTQNNIVSGKLFWDFDNNCQKSTGDLPTKKKIVKAKSLKNGITYYGVSNDSGYYKIIAPSFKDTFILSLENNPTLQFCQNNLFAIFPDSSKNIDFYLKAKENCFQNEVRITCPILRQCPFNNTYQVTYQNNGTKPSLNTYIIVTLDQYMTLVSADKKIIDLGNGMYRFDVGDLEMLDAGTINLIVTLDCKETALGQTKCVSAEIFPTSDCSDNNASKIVINSACSNGNARFDIENKGVTPLDEVNYVIIEDDMIFKQTTKLPTIVPNQKFPILTPANGSTWRVEIRESLTNQLLTAGFYEGCGVNTEGKSSIGYAAKLPLPDNIIFFDRECKEIVGSYDPNDKQGYPLGLTQNHFIEANTPIDYLIRFQNTGTDTAFLVKITDFIDNQKLDLETIKFISASHPVEYSFEKGNTLVCTFNNIMLPDSGANQAASQGFVRFLINQKKDLPINTKIKNKAEIYFDANQPIVTNETFHVINKDFLMFIVSSEEPTFPNIDIVIKPNPFHSNAIIEVKGVETDDLRLELTDIFGNLILSQKTDNNQFNLSSDNMTAGVKIYAILKGKQIIAKGKVLVY